ncbi:MAG: tyrosine-type recombinase/integrase [Bryobacteraceae bacterium]|nr:tyrosine-type recombinase/integrase [Bryobacteraceae bacterium]
MPRTTNGSGTLYLRGDIWWVKLHIDGRPVYQSSKSTKKSDAIKLRDQLLAKKHRGEISGGAPDRVLIGELLDDLIKSDVKEATRYIYEKVIEKSIRPYFGKYKVTRLTTGMMEDYRKKRNAEGAKDSTVNRELSVMRSALYKGKRRTPPKVNVIPYFPLVKETNVRKGFLTDEQYTALRDALPDELKPMFVAGFVTGMRLGEILAIKWPQVDFESGYIVLQTGETKNGEGRAVPILDGDMRDYLMTAKKERDAAWPHCEQVFSRMGEPIKRFTTTWRNACVAAGVPELNFHDLRRTAVRNMRRAGIPQVVRMKISGHKTDSMERRYNIVDAEDLSVAKELLERRMKLASVTKNVTMTGNGAKLGDTAD